MSVERQDNSVIASLQAIMQAEADRLEEEARLEREREATLAEAKRIADAAARDAEARRVAQIAAEREAGAAREREQLARLRAIEEAEKIRAAAEEARRTQLAHAQLEAEREIRIKALSEDGKKARLRRWLYATCAALAISVSGGGAYYAGVVLPANRAFEAELAKQNAEVARLQDEVATLAKKLGDAKTADEVAAVKSELASTASALAVAQQHQAETRAHGTTKPVTATKSNDATPGPKPTCKEGDPMAGLDCVKR